MMAHVKTVLSGNLLLRISALLFSAYILFPMVLLVVLSFGEGRYLQLPPSDWSPRWYWALVEDSSWLAAVADSLAVALPTSVLATLAGINTALVSSYYKTRFSSVLQYLVLAPLMLPGVIYAVSLYFYFSEIGLLESYVGMIIAHSCICIPISHLIVHSGLTGKNFDLELAALTLGAKAEIILLKITLPRIKNQIIASLAFCFITSFDEPVINLFIAGNNIVTVPKRMWDGIRFEIDPSVMAMSAVLISIVIAIVILDALIRNRSS